MQKLFSSITDLDKNIFKIMKYGFWFSGLLAVIASIILLTYIFIGTNILFHIGFILFQSSLSIAVEFFICGVVVDFIRKQGI